MEKTMRGSAHRWLAGAGISVAAAVILAACGGGGGGDVPQGTLRMSMTDAPSCYRNVFVTVEEVRVHQSDSAAEGAGGWQVIVPPNGPVRVDLMNLTNGALVDLGATEVNAGAYSQIRLVLSSDVGANEVVLLDGTPKALDTPSAAQSGLKIHADFSVAADATTDMLLDFDACTSIVKAGNSGKYILKPVVRVSSKPTGSISGQVTTTMTLSETSVSAQLNGEILRSTVPASDGTFRLAYLAPGSYTVVITSTDRTTGVVSSVPVGTTTTSLPGYIAMPTSAVNTITGTVTTGDPKVLATVTASQAVSTGTIQVLTVPVDYDLHTYTMTLPSDDPLRAPYSSTTLTFNADTTANGRYTLTATDVSGAQVTRTNVDPATTPVVDFVFP